MTGPGWRGPVVVTGTDTGVGKTVVTAAIAAAAGAAGLRVAVLKPAQTGVPAAGAGAGTETSIEAGTETDVEAVRRLAGPATARTLASFPDPLAPLAAARVSGRPAVRLGSAVAATTYLASDHDLVLVEGAGGLLVALGEGGWTLADLAAAVGARAVVVARAGLGTLNHTALTLRALAGWGIPARVVLGAWPARVELVHRTNLHDLPGELAGAVPDGVGGWTGERFTAAAPGWLAADLHGCFDPAAFRAAGR